VYLLQGLLPTVAMVATRLAHAASFNVPAITDGATEAVAPARLARGVRITAAEETFVMTMFHGEAAHFPDLPILKRLHHPKRP
jgi:hypothetical protein